MNKKELIEAIKLEAGNDLPRNKIEAHFDAMLAVIAKEVISGGEIQLRGICTISTRDAKERIRKNPKTGEKIIVPAGKVLHIKAAAGLRFQVRKSN